MPGSTANVPPSSRRATNTVGAKSVEVSQSIQAVCFSTAQRDGGEPVSTGVAASAGPDSASGRPVDASRPASLDVSDWDGDRYGPVTGAAVDWATASDATTVITFDAVRGSRLRLLLTSAHPGAADGAVRISRLEVPAG